MTRKQGKTCWEKLLICDLLLGCPLPLAILLAACVSTLIHALTAPVAPASDSQPKPANLPMTVEDAQASQADTARALGIEAELVNGLGMKLSLIPPGRFTLGPNGSTYRVAIKKPFYVGITEVTLGQYRRFKPGHEVAGAPPEFNADDVPTALVSWNDAQAFCHWLSDRPEERQAGRTYSLPTEAQWEWAARAGTTTTRYFGDTDKDQAEYSWFNHTYTPNPEHESNGRGRQPVGRLKPNAWGLFDMLGNVWEWCGDRRSNEMTGEEWQPVMRGGSWRSGAFHCTAVAHDPGDPNTKADNIGFRVVCQVAPRPGGDAGTASSTPQFPGKRSDWNGYDRFDFEVDGRPVLVVAPKQPASGKPWVWHGEFFGHKPAPDIALLGKGFHIVYMSVPDMLGCPEAVEHWNAFYKELTEKYGFAKKAALVGLSRGGLYVYNWAEANPDKVACIYADAAVCDFKSWPGGKGKGKGSPRDWQLVLDRYHFKDEAEALAYDKNPIDNLEPLAKAHVPLLHVYGDADDVVPWNENTGVVADRYKKLGGEITLIAKPGVGHHPHGLEDSTPIVEFILKHSRN